MFGFTGKSKTSTISALFFAAVTAVPAQVTFVQAPSMVPNGAGGWTITFELSQNTDVEVSIVNVTKAAVVRHLAAGVLGAQPPAPFAANAPAQTLTWDGKDDFGRAVTNPESLSVRVRAGVSMKLTNLAGENLYDRSGTPSIRTDSRGNSYILSNGSGQSPFLRKYDSAGNYIKTLFPPPAHLPAASVRSYQINELPDGGWVPKSAPTNGNGVQFTALALKGATITAVSPDGSRLQISGKSGLHTIDSNGCFTDSAANPILALMKPVAAEKSPVLAKELVAFHDGPYVFERVAVDRATDRVFWNGSYYISDWSNPVIRKLPVTLDNITVAPNGFIFGWNTVGSVGVGEAFIRRYSGTTYTAVPYGNTSNNNVTGQIHYEYGWAGTPGCHRGIGVGWQGQVASFTEGAYLFEVQDTGGSITAGGYNSPITGGSHRKLVSTDLSVTGAYSRQGMMGVKYDPAGNWYAGLRKRAPKTIVPAPSFATDHAFQRIGAIAKFHRDSLAVAYNPVTGTLNGYERLYPQPFGPFTKFYSGWDALGDAGCMCRNSLFDVDPYGRLYVPSGVTSQVFMADNAGNTIAAIGSYGNTDSRGPLSGPGQTYSKPDIPLAWPTSVGASEDFIYITDVVNARLVQVKMAYALDNYTGLTDHNIRTEAGKKGKTIALESAPVPFNPQSRIRVYLPFASHLELKVYSTNGRLVRSLADGRFYAGAHQFIWDATNSAGQTVGAGVYLYKLSAGHRTLISRTIMAK